MSQASADSVPSAQGETNIARGSLVEVKANTFYVRPPVTGELKSTRGGWIFMEKKNKNGAWAPLNEKLEEDRKIYLCEYTKLRHMKTTETKMYFLIQDGPNKDKEARLSKSNDRFIDKNPPQNNDAEIIVTYKNNPQNIEVIYSKVYGENFYQYLAEMDCGGMKFHVTLKSHSSYNILSAGIHRICVPDSPHPKDYTDDYYKINNMVKYDQVWFPIHQSNDAYIHLGNASHGCVTVMGTVKTQKNGTYYIDDIERWSDVYKYLIKHRSPGNDKRGNLEQFIGNLVVNYV